MVRTRSETLLRGAVVAVLGLLVPSLLLGGEAPAIVLVAAVAAAVVAMASIAIGHQQGAGFVLEPAHTDRDDEHPMTGRVTDPEHHPIRRRAPGQV